MNKKWLPLWHHLLHLPDQYRLFRVTHLNWCWKPNIQPRSWQTRLRWKLKFSKIIEKSTFVPLQTGTNGKVLLWSQALTFTPYPIGPTRLFWWGFPMRELLSSMPRTMDLTVSLLWNPERLNTDPARLWLCEYVHDACTVSRFLGKIADNRWLLLDLAS